MGPLEAKGPERPAKRKLNPAMDGAADGIDEQEAFKLYATWPSHEICKKGPWDSFEDMLLIERVQEIGAKCWSRIAEALPGRIGKQCRERWHNHLDPSINKKRFTVEEEMHVSMAVSMYGHQWAKIAKELPGRTDNAIKNWYGCHIARKWDKLGEQQADDAQFASELRDRQMRCKDNPSSAMQWSMLEEVRLVRSAMKYNTRQVGSWEKIAGAVGSRTVPACKRHWKLMRQGLGTIQSQGRLSSQDGASMTPAEAYHYGLDAFGMRELLVEEEEEQEVPEPASLNLNTNLLADEAYDEGNDQDEWTTSATFVVGDTSFGGLHFTFPPQADGMAPKPAKKTAKKPAKKPAKTAAAATPLPASTHTVEAAAVTVAAYAPGPSVAPVEAQTLCARTCTAAQEEWVQFQQDEALEAVMEASAALLAQQRMSQSQEQHLQQYQMHEFYNEAKRREEGAAALEKNAFA